MRTVEMGSSGAVARSSWVAVSQGAPLDTKAAQKELQEKPS